MSRHFAGHQIYNWHIELSSKCALKCPRCTRTEYPGTYPVTQLGLAFIQKLFTPQLLKESVQRITFSGGVGDPLYNTELQSIFAYLKSQNPEIQIVLITNGSHKSAAWWKELLQHTNEYDEIIFSVDGWDHASNNLYRINSDWNSIMVGIDEAVRSKAQVRWSTIVFKFNEDKVADIRDLAKAKGVDKFFYVFSERFGNHYVDPETGIDPLEPSAEKRSQIPRTQRTKEVFSTNPLKQAGAKKVFKMITPSFDESYDRTHQTYGDSYIFPTCKFGYRGLYVDVEGILYPCSWVSHRFDVKSSHVNPQRVLHYKDGFIKYKDRLNLNLRSLQEVLTDPLWKEIEDGWRSEESAFIICERKCLAKNSKLPQLETPEVKAPTP